jgi:hypothetical protein
MYQCTACDNTDWVCEDHPDRPSDCGNSPRACACGAAGRPCLICNQPGNGERRRLPAGFVPRDDADSGALMATMPARRAQH